MFLSKAEIHLFFNSWHSPFFDTFFHYFTHVGDGFTALGIILILLAVRYRLALQVALATFISALITQTLKHTIFEDHVRPVEFFRNLGEIYLVPGVENHLYNSFPSGHSTCAFAVFISLALIVRSARLKTAYLIVALLIGYSRIYLSQHFFEDVYAGSLIGTATAIGCFYFTSRSERPWLNSNLRHLMQ
jgi:membrane-associated phospholipid phosphatase